MKYSGGLRRGLLSAGGVISVAAGIYQIVCSGLIVVDFVVGYPHNWRLIYALLLPGLPEAWARYVLWGPKITCDLTPPIRWAIIGGCLGYLGIVAVAGGISAIRRKRFELSLGGAISTLPSVFAVIPAVILVCLGRRAFKAKEMDAEVV